MDNKEQTKKSQIKELSRAEKKALAQKMLEKTTQNKINNNKYFDFYDDALERALDLKEGYKNDGDFSLSLYEIDEMSI